jgi:hypothetical protein
MIYRAYIKFNAETEDIKSFLFYNNLLFIEINLKLLSNFYSDMVI